MNNFILNRIFKIKALRKEFEEKIRKLEDENEKLSLENSSLIFEVKGLKNLKTQLENKLNQK